MHSKLSSHIYSSEAPGSRGPVRAADLEEGVRYNLYADLPLLIRSKDQARRVGRRAQDFLGQIIYLHKAERLMDIAREAIIESDKRRQTFSSCRVWWAGSLSGAKGRMNRQWQADPGGIYLCIAIYPALLRERWHLYNIAAGVGICEILREWGVEAEIRWLNDILLRGKKTAGILAETMAAPCTGEQYLLTGVGINANQRHFAPEIRGASTSLFIETGRNWPILDLGVHVLSRISIYYALLHDWEASFLNEDAGAGNCCPVIKAYKGLCRSTGRKVRYGRDLENTPGIPAVAGKITQEGALMLVLEDGREITADTGEIRYLD